MVLAIALVVIVWQLLCGIAAGQIADTRHRSWAWCLVGYVFGLFGVALIWLMPPRTV
jgi:hypothetical protein